MSLLTELTTALRTGAVQVVDLTAPLSEDTPIIQLPAERGQPWPFQREVISNYDAPRAARLLEQHPAVRAHRHPLRRARRTGCPARTPEDVSQVPPARLVGPAAVIDMTAEVALNPDFLLEREHVEAWAGEHGPLPEGGWLLYRTGWDARGDQQAFLNDKHTPGVSRGLRALARRGDPAARFRRGDRRHRRRSRR